MNNSVKNAVQKLVNSLGYKITRISNTPEIIDPIIDQDQKFIRIYDECKKYTMTSKERMYALYKAVEYVIDSKVSGDFVECGVWQGGSMMLVARVLLDSGVMDRKIYLYDTFTGMSAPTENDYALSDNDPAIGKWKSQQKKGYNNWAFASLAEVKKNMLATGYLEHEMIFVPGKVEEMIPRTNPDPIAILRLDTDWYESTKHELVHLFPLITNGGVLIIDDYGHYAGSKKAVDEYLQGKSVLLNRIDYCGRIGVKSGCL